MAGRHPFVVSYNDNGYSASTGNQLVVMANDMQDAIAATHAEVYDVDCDGVQHVSRINGVRQLSHDPHRWRLPYMAWLDKTTMAWLESRGWAPHRVSKCMAGATACPAHANGSCLARERQLHDYYYCAWMEEYDVETTYHRTPKGQG